MLNYAFSPAEKTLDFREIAETPRLKKAWAITHPKGVTPICSDFPVFFRFVPICALVFWNTPIVPISSDLFRFAFRTNRQPVDLVVGDPVRQDNDKI